MTNAVLVAVAVMKQVVVVVDRPRPGPDHSPAAAAVPLPHPPTVDWFMDSLVDARCLFWCNPHSFCDWQGIANNTASRHWLHTIASNCHQPA